MKRLIPMLTIVILLASISFAIPFGRNVKYMSPTGYLRWRIFDQYGQWARWDQVPEIAEAFGITFPQ